MTLIERLAASGPVLTDGAWGSLLQGRGLEPEECPDAWNLSHPEKVEEVARAYVEAGSQVILTNTFRANRLALARYGLAERVAEINRAGVAISVAVARGRAQVIDSMGPSGKLLVTGETTEEELRAVFLNAHRDERGKELLDKMMIDKFIIIEDSAYDSVREMKSWISRHKEHENTR